MNCCLLILILLFCGNCNGHGRDCKCGRERDKMCNDTEAPESRMPFAPFSCGNTCGCEEKPV